MSSTVTASPAGRPSTITTSACPCDSPAVRKRSIGVTLLARGRVTERAGAQHRRLTPDGIGAAGELGSAAARITAGSGRTPVHSSCCSTAWWTSMPRPSTARQPARRGGPQQRRLERVVHEVGDDLAGAQQRRVERQLVGAHADRRGVDDDVGAGDVVGRADPGRPAPARRPPRPAPRVRLTTAMSAAPARPSASTTLRAAAAGADHGDRGAGDVDAGRGQRGDEAVAVGAVADEASVAPRRPPC